MNEVITIKIEKKQKEDLMKIAKKKGFSLSKYVRELLLDNLENQQRIDLLVRNMYDEVIQLQGMLTILLGFEKKVFATLLGRTEPENLTVPDLAKAKAKREKALNLLEQYLTSVSENVMEGENIWGTIMTLDQED